MDEIVEEVAIVNPQGLHARPAGALVQKALKFECDIYIVKNTNKVNAKSIMGLLTLAAAQGTKLKIICKGSDARQAMDAIRALIEAGFNENKEG